VCVSRNCLCLSVCVRINQEARSEANLLHTSGFRVQITIPKLEKVSSVEKFGPIGKEEARTTGKNAGKRTSKGITETIWGGYR